MENAPDSITQLNQRFPSLSTAEFFNKIRHKLPLK
jgi:hypothetical protein